MNIQNWKVGTRLGVGFALMSGLLLVISVVSFLRLTATESEIDLILEDRYPKVETVMGVQLDIGQISRLSQIGRAHV